MAACWRPYEAAESAAEAPSASAGADTQPSSMALIWSASKLKIGPCGKQRGG
jgi:hypothetical protein